MDYTPLRLDLEIDVPEPSYVSYDPLLGQCAPRSGSRNGYGPPINGTNGAVNGWSLQKEWTQPLVSPKSLASPKARALTRNSQPESLWFSSFGAPNPNVFRDGVPVQSDYYGNGHSMESPVDASFMPTSARNGFPWTAISTSGTLSMLNLPPPPEGWETPRPLSDLALVKEEDVQFANKDVGEGEAEVERKENDGEDEILDRSTQILYDELLTHFLDEVASATKEILCLYYVYSACSVLTTSMAIVLNALIMVAKHLNIPKQAITIFAALNMIAKGLDMKFKFGHESQSLQGCLEDAKILSAEAEDLLLKCKHDCLEKSEIMEFKIYYTKAFREFAYYVPARDLDGLGEGMLEEKSSDKKSSILEEEDEIADVETEELFMDQLQHYERQLKTATSSLQKAFCLANAAATVLILLTLCINPMIISAGELHLSRTFVAYLAGINTIVKGFELRFKFEQQKSHLEHQLEKAHVLRTEVEQLMILAEDKRVTDIEVSSFKRALDDAMEGFAMYMLDGDTEIFKRHRKAPGNTDPTSSTRSADSAAAKSVASEGGGSYAVVPQDA